MANPRDHIRAAQAAELRGDKAGAIEELRKAAELYRRAGNSSRALQLLRHARALDPSRVDVAEELSRIEWLPDTSIARALQGEGPSAGEGVLELNVEPDALAERQRLIEQALQQAGLPEAGGETPDAVKRWLVEDSPRERPAEESGSKTKLDRRSIEEPSLAEDETIREPLPVKALRSQVALEVKAIVEGEMTAALVADVEGNGSEELRPTEEVALPPEEPMREAPSREDRAMIDRGPTRADPAIDAWCSFCCRPRVEVGDMVAGPTGSFICAACVGESRGLLALDDTTTVRSRPSRRKEEASEKVELVGQQEARALLERALAAGARRVLVIGPMGTGKSVWFQELARQERGAFMALDALAQGAGGPVVLVEDVDRLPPEEQERLGGLLVRQPDRTVLMSARGVLGAPRLVLHGAAGSLPVLSTRALSDAVGGLVALSLLEQVQLAVGLQAPTRSEFTEIARRRLAPRGSELSVTEEVLSALASEAANSPRAGHELNALLARVLAGSWSLTAADQETTIQEPRSPDVATKPARRSRRKGTP